MLRNMWDVARYAILWELDPSVRFGITITESTKVDYRYESLVITMYQERKRFNHGWQSAAPELLKFLRMIWPFRTFSNNSVQKPVPFGDIMYKQRIKISFKKRWIKVSFTKKNHCVPNPGRSGWVSESRLRRPQLTLIKDNQLGCSIVFQIKQSIAIMIQHCIHS